MNLVELTEKYKQTYQTYIYYRDNNISWLNKEEKIKLLDFLWSKITSYKESIKIQLSNMEINLND